MSSLTATLYYLYITCIPSLLITVYSVWNLDSKHSKWFNITKVFFICTYISILNISFITDLLLHAFLISFLVFTWHDLVCSAVCKKLWGQWRQCVYDVPSLICCMPCFIYLCHVLYVNVNFNTCCTTIHLCCTKISIFVVSTQIYVALT